MSAELNELETSLWQAKTLFNRTYMDRILASDFFEFGRSGRRWTRDECLDFGNAAEIDAKLPLEDFNVLMIDDQTALVTYVSEVMYETVLRSNRSSLWSKTDIGWKLRFHQGTPTS